MMLRFRPSCAICVLLLASCIIQGQSNPKAPTEAPKRGANDQSSSTRAAVTKDTEAERIRAERRANAQNLLLTLAADAAKFNDSAVRARTLARVADQLWETDPDRARVMFRSAWEAAEVAEREAGERYQEYLRQSSRTSGGFSSAPSQPQVRREVLRLATKRDRSLGEEFLARQKESAAKPKSSRPHPLGNTDALLIQRLDVARQLVEAGQIDQALQFADSVLNIVNSQTVDFLSFLREKNPATADERYAAILTGAAANPQADANTVSLLSSYIFTPHSFIAFTREGTFTNNYEGNRTPAAVTPALQLSFFRAAAAILLRPIAPPGEEQDSSGHDGHYLVIKRLLPLFEQRAPADLTAALRAQLETLSALITKATHDRDDDDFARTGIRPDKFEENWEQSLLDELDRARTSAERDQVHFRLAVFYASKGELQARDYVDKIDDADMRNNARAYIDTKLASHAVYKKDVARIMELVRTGEFAHVQKVRLLTQAAKLLAKTENEKALTLIDLAATEARRISASEADSPRAFFAVANAVLVVNRSAVWDVMSEAIKAANSAETFRGEDAQLSFSMTSKGMSWSQNESVPDFDLDGIFTSLAGFDYDRSVELAQGFTREAPRAVATIAIARTVLSETKK